MYIVDRTLDAEKSDDVTLRATLVSARVDGDEKLPHFRAM